MIFDITEKMQAQDALQVAQAEIAQSTQSSRMGAMTASIAHEIKQPLAAIMTNANAGLRWIGQTPPNVAETRVPLERGLFTKVSVTLFRTSERCSNMKEPPASPLT